MAQVLSAIKSGERFILMALMLAGVLIASWPLAENAYGRWSQHNLRVGFEARVQQPVSTQSGKLKRRSSTLQKKSAAKHAPVVQAGKVKPGKAKPKRQMVARVARWEPVQLLVPAIDVDAIVVSGVDAAALRHGPGHDPHSALPGQVGNCVIAAHRNAYGWWFRRLHELKEGAFIRLQTANRAYTYVVTGSTVVSQWDTTVLQPPASDIPRLTLYSCTLPKSQRRLVVFADLASADDTGVSTN